MNPELERQARAEVLERLGLDESDAALHDALQQLVQLAGIATACPFAALVLRADAARPVIAASALDPDRREDWQRQAARLPVSDAFASVHEGEADGGALGLRAGASVPVPAADGSVAGWLLVASDRRSRIDTAVSRTALEAAASLAAGLLRIGGEAVRDPLTGLHNRRQLRRQLELEWRRAARERQPLSALVVDIDHFKDWNDTLGHAAGDQALVRVARLLRSRARRAGDLVCRSGGEEFTMLLPRTGLSDACHLAESLRVAVEGSGLVRPGPPPQPLTVSIGVACADFSSSPAFRSPEALLDAADQAMYRAKRSGRNRVQCAGPATETAG